MVGSLRSSTERTRMTNGRLTNSSNTPNSQPTSRATSTDGRAHAPRDDFRGDPRLPQPRHAHGQTRYQRAEWATARDAGVVRARRRGGGVHDVGRLSQGPE